MPPTYISCPYLETRPLQSIGWVEILIKRQNLNKEADTHSLQGDHAKGHKEVGTWRLKITQGSDWGSMLTSLGIPSTVSN